MYRLLCLCLLFASGPVLAASSLLSIYQEAIGNDPSLLLEQALNRAAESQEDEARGLLLPQINSSHSFSRTQRDDNISRDNYSGRSHNLTLRQSLYDPTGWRSYQRYKEIAKSQHWSSQEKINLNMIQLVELYFDILAAEDEYRLTQAELDATRHNQKRTQALYKRQMATLPEVLNIDARVASLEAALLDAQSTIQDSREQLAARIGRPLSEPLWPLSPNANLSQLLPSAADWETLALQQNPALQSQALQINAASNAYRAAQAGHLPQVNLNLSAQYSDIGYEGASTPQSATLIAAIGVQIPLFSGGATHAHSTMLLAEKSVAEQEYERSRREVLREVRAARQRLVTGPERIQATLQAQEAASKSRLAAERAYELGVMDSVNLLERIRDDFKAQRDLLRAKYSYINNILLLHRWAGSLGMEDIQRSNELLQPLLTHPVTP